MKQYSNRSQPGFSLLEILIAAAILPNVGRAPFMSRAVEEEQRTKCMEILFPRSVLGLFGRLSKVFP
jgi:prepilin-type N-terminal cleavage/methylation domain-containing protein